MRNPVYSTVEKMEPFTYFHTHIVTREILGAVIAAKKPLELDISIAPDGEIYIGHPLPMYDFYHLPPPNNLPLDTAVAEAKAAGLYLVFDVKDVRVLPRVQEIIESYGTDRCLLHACTNALIFKPYSKKIVMEPHWNEEQIELEAILKVKRATGVPLALCSRGISEELLAAQGEDSVLQKILDVVRSNAEVFVPNLPKDELPPLSMMQKLLEHKILSLISIDRVPPAKRPSVFLGATDFLDQASTFDPAS